MACHATRSTWCTVDVRRKVEGLRRARRVAAQTAPSILRRSSRLSQASTTAPPMAARPEKVARGCDSAFSSRALDFCTASNKAVYLRQTHNCQFVAAGLQVACKARKIPCAKCIERTNAAHIDGCCRSMFRLDKDCADKLIERFCMRSGPSGGGRQLNRVPLRSGL